MKSEEKLPSLPIILIGEIQKPTYVIILNFKYINFLLKLHRY